MYFAPPLILGGTRAISQNLELNAQKCLTLTILSFRASVGLDVGNCADPCGAESSVDLQPGSPCCSGPSGQHILQGNPKHLLVTM